MSQSASSQSALEILIQSKAVIKGDHFVYISGDHGSGWIDKDVIYPHTDRICELARLLAGEVRDLGAEIVLGPATGGLVLSQWLAHHLGVLSAFAEHDYQYHAGGNHETQDTRAVRPPFVLKRHYNELVKGRRVLVVDDIVNTGLSIRQTLDAAVEAGAKVIAAAAICTRGNTGAEEIGCDFLYLTEVKIPAWPADKCHLCRDGVPVNVHYAHGMEFVRARGATA